MTNERNLTNAELRRIKNLLKSKKRNISQIAEKLNRSRSIIYYHAWKNGWIKKKRKYTKKQTKNKMMKIKPELMDRLGLGAWIILLFSGIRVFQFGGKQLEIYSFIIILISIVGLIIDGYIVTTEYLSRIKK